LNNTKKKTEKEKQKAKKEINDKWAGLNTTPGVRRPVCTD
jgi:hypothetical protein